jgi:flagellar motor switch protein FliN/FliY
LTVAVYEASTSVNPVGNGKDEAAVINDGKFLSSENADALELGALRQAPMTVQVEVGRTVMTLGEILDEVDVGSNIRLDRHAGEPVEVYVNGALFARAEVVVMQDQIGAKIVEIVDSSRRLRPSGLR